MPVKRRANSLGTLLRDIAYTREIKTTERERERSGEREREVIDTLSGVLIAGESRRGGKKESKEKRKTAETRERDFPSFGSSPRVSPHHDSLARELFPREMTLSSLRCFTECHYEERDVQVLP